MKKAFTLVELLAVIIVLGILVGISYPVVNETIKDSKQKVYYQNVKLIEEAAKKYLINHENNEQSLNNKITLDDLKQEKLIEGEFINPINKEKMNGCVIYNWNTNFNQYDIKYEDTCS